MTITTSTQATLAIIKTHSLSTEEALVIAAHRGIEDLPTSEDVDSILNAVGAPMNEKQLKRHFEDKGLKIADIVREMNLAFPGITANAADQMLRQLIAGQRWYPRYAQWLKDKYNVTVAKPAYIQPIRERMRLVA